MIDSFIPYGRHEISEDDIDSVVRVLKSDFLTQGPMVEEFEKAISQTVNSKYAVAVNSGTSALHIACISLGLNQGDHLWTTPITFVASANCGLYCGASVDFVDINPQTGLMCIEKLEQKLKEAKISETLPKIVIPVHLAGTSCDMPKIYQLSIKYGFSIIEDASHAIGGCCHNTSVGSCKYSDITIFSLHPVKIITSGEGGIATTNQEGLNARMKSLRLHGIIHDRSLFENSNVGQWFYEQKYLGYNYRMNDILAALGLSQLKKLEKFIKLRTDLIEQYKEYIKDLPIRLLEVPKGVKSSYHLAIIRLDNKKDEFHRHIFDSLRAKNIGVQVHYTPVHLQPYYKKLGFSTGDFPLAEEYSKNSISLPIYPSISKKDFERVLKTLDDLFKN